jgi:hypothetical protein
VTESYTFSTCDQITASGLEYTQIMQFVETLRMGHTSHDQAPSSLLASLQRNKIVIANMTFEIIRPYLYQYQRPFSSQGRSWPFLQSNNLSNLRH